MCHPADKWGRHRETHVPVSTIRSAAFGYLAVVTAAVLIIANYDALFRCNALRSLVGEIYSPKKYCVWRSSQQGDRRASGQSLN